MKTEGASEVKHTPGPWIIHPMKSSRTGLDAGSGFDYPWHIVPASHAGRYIGGSIDKEYDRVTYAKEICTFMDFNRFEREEVQANARLIAAAPAMLEALEGLLATIAIPAIKISIDASEDDIWEKAIKDSRAAIRLAEGETK